MKTLKQVDVIPVFVDEYLPSDQEMEQGKIYISKKYKGTSHLCLCGCGVKCFLNILPSKDGWTLIENSPGVISITPSILQRFDCKSHYIITKNKANFV